MPPRSPTSRPSPSASPPWGARGTTRRSFPCGESPKPCDLRRKLRSGGLRLSDPVERLESRTHEGGLHMFGRTHGTTTRRFTEAAGSVMGYVDPLVHDDKLRKRIAAAVTAGMAAGRQAQKQKGLRGAVSRLATDQVLRAQIGEAAAHLRAAADRAEKTRRHRV